MRAAERAERNERLAGDVAARLRNVCAHLCPAEFERLVADLVAMRARFRVIDRDPALWCNARDHPAFAPGEDRAFAAVRPRAKNGRRDD